jgi:hypothetical protein
MISLNLQQIDQIQSILKIYAVTSGLFDSDENGEFTNRDKEVILPYTNVKITYNQINELRGILKKEKQNILTTVK